MKRNLNWLSGAMAVALLCGCVPPPFDDGPGEDEGTFLAMDMTGFGSPEALALMGGAVTAESNLVTLPEELVQSASEELTMTLSAPQIDTSLDAGQANPFSKDGAFHATITFHLAAPGEDACSSLLTVGPYEISLAGGNVQIAKSAIPLPAEAAELVRSGRFGICAETSADFDGALSVSELIIEFGKLNPGDTRVEICHVPPGNPNVRHTIIVGSSALNAHLAKGSYLGPCLDVVEPLQLTSVCSNQPELQRRWRIVNPNSFAREVSWEVYGTAQTGTLTAGPGQTWFETEAVEGPNTAVIRWTDHNGIVRSAVKASGAVQCVIDADGDGVPDEMDQCPSTPAGLEVDEAGCACSEKDSDADGVDDCTDACPATPPGLEVDETGCTCADHDADGDGVDDCTDACPATPAAEQADETGCSCSQLDQDSDGVNDCDDFCPFTPPGAAVDLWGCEVMVASAGEDVILQEVTPVTLQATVSGGTPPYSYSWSADGWSGSSQQNVMVMPAQTTTYTLMVVDWSFPPKIATATVTIHVEPTPAQLRYVATDLGSLSTRNSYATGLNDIGQVVGYYHDDDWAMRAFLFSDGSLIDLGTLGGNEAYASAINNHGQVTGQAQTASGQWHAFLWDAGTGMQDLGTLGGNLSEAYAINDLGQVVGYSATASGNKAFIWSGGTMSQVPGVNAYAQSAAFDINQSGQMVGILLAASGASTAFKYDGLLANLGTPMLTAAEAWSINENGLIAGHAWGAGQYRSFIYADGVVLDLGLLTGFERTYAWGLSDSGQVVGTVTSAASGLSNAFIYRGGQIINLNSMLAPDSGWEYLTAANAINNHGQIAGYGKINGKFHAFLLTPSQ